LSNFLIITDEYFAKNVEAVNIVIFRTVFV